MQLAQDRWYVVLSTTELGNAPLGVRRLGLDLVFWRDGEGRPQVAVDRCPHRGAALSAGEVIDGCVVCPFHGFRFNGDGACTAIPAHPDRTLPKAMSLAMLGSREAHGFVWVWTGPTATPSTPVPFFDLEGWCYTGSELREPVATHYTRAIENQLDFAHLPFVHRSTIGRGMDPAMDIETVVDGDHICAFQRASVHGASIEVLAPNIWRLKTGPTWSFLAMVPVDDRQMIYYVRTYQRWTSRAPLAWLIGTLGRPLTLRVLRQDTPPVESQPVVETRLKMDEVLVPSDGPIIAYRRWREAVRRELDPWGDRRRGTRRPSSSPSTEDTVGTEGGDRGD